MPPDLVGTGDFTGTATCLGDGLMLATTLLKPLDLILTSTSHLLDSDRSVDLDDVIDLVFWRS